LTLLAVSVVITHLNRGAVAPSCLGDGCQESKGEYAECE
jgi:hypothetical protein